MSDAVYVERIAPDLEELMPRFFELSKVDIQKMRQAIAAEDMEALIRMGHTAKGTGAGYGFQGMSALGREIEDAAKAGELAEVERLVDRLRHYFETVVVEFA